MEKFELQKLRDLPIEGVAERLGLRVERHKCLCPFHDDHTPSLTFRKNKFRCWSCGECGGTIDLVMKYLNKDFKEACGWLDPLQTSPRGGLQSLPRGEEKKPKVPLRGDLGGVYARFFEHPFLNEEARKFLFEERRLDERVVRWCRLTSWRDRRGVPWLQIPYYDREGQLVGIQNRRLKSPSGDLEGSGLPRFRFPQGSECGIYNLPVLNRLKAGDELFIAEGCSDCWSLLSAGHKAIAIPSATLLTQKDIEQLSIINGQCSMLNVQWSMYPDNDAPGDRLFLQLQKVLPSLVHHQLPLGCKDFSEYYVKQPPSNSPQRGRNKSLNE